MAKQKAGRGRNANMDALKGVAALLVCYQHACGSDAVSQYLLGVARIAVPLFAMATAYYYPDTVRARREGRQLRKFLIIAAQMVLFYFAVECVYRVLSHELGDYLKSVFSLRALGSFLLLNDPVPGDHSWYMWAMLYTLALARLAPAFWKRRRLRAAIGIASAGMAVLLSKYLFLFRLEPIPAVWYRNFLVPMIGWFCAGIALRAREKRGQLPGAGVWAGLTAVCVALVFAEKTLLTHLGVDHSTGTYLADVLLAVSVFALFLRLGNIPEGHPLAVFGRRYSLMFYIIHPLFVRMEVRLFDMTGPMQHAGVLFVAACSLAWCVAADIIRQRLPRGHRG